MQLIGCKYIIFFKRNQTVAFLLEMKLNFAFVNLKLISIFEQMKTAKTTWWWINLRRTS